MKPQKKIVKCVPKPRVWKLKDEEIVKLITCEMAARNDDVTKTDDVQVCEMTKGPPRHKEIWWWNIYVEEGQTKGMSQNLTDI